MRIQLKLRVRDLTLYLPNQIRFVLAITTNDALKYHKIIIDIVQWRICCQVTIVSESAVDVPISET